MSKKYQYEGEGEYVVGFLDVIGFEYLLKKHGIEIIYRSLERIFSLPQVYIKGRSNKFYQFYDPSTGESFSTGEVKQTTKEILENGIFNFSDSVIIFSQLKEDKDENAILLGYICRLVNLFLSKTILDPHDENIIPLPFRAGVSIGKGYVNKDDNLHIGEPFIRAYKLAESQKWMGGVLDKNEYLEQKMIDEIYGPNNDIIKYDIDFKKRFEIEYDELNHAMNLPQLHGYDHSLGEFYRDGPKYDDLKYHIKNHDWDNKETKRRNTLDFAKHICEKWDERFHSIIKSYLTENEKASLDEIWDEVQSNQVTHDKQVLKKVLGWMVMKGEISKDKGEEYKLC